MLVNQFSTAFTGCRCPFAKLARETTRNESSFQNRCQLTAESVVHDSVPKRCGGDLPAFGLVD